MYLTRMEKKRPGGSGYPCSTAVWQKNDVLTFENPVTMLCGDNGCGKTTLIELIAAKLGAQRISSVNGLSAGQQHIRSAADGWRAGLRRMYPSSRAASNSRLYR